MNKKGFTLIELLAIIVILGILASISTMMVGNYIKNSKQESTRVVAINMLNAVDDELELKCMNAINSDGCRYDWYYNFLDDYSNLLEKELTTSAWGNDIVDAVVNYGYYENESIVWELEVCIRDSKGYGIRGTEKQIRENSNDIVYENINNCTGMPI